MECVVVHATMTMAAGGADLEMAEAMKQEAIREMSERTTERMHKCRND